MPAVARRGIVGLTLSCLSRWKSSAEVPKELGLDALQFCKRGKEKYVEQLVALGPALIPLWAVLDVDDDRAMCFAQPQLSVNFRY